LANIDNIEKCRCVSHYIIIPHSHHIHTLYIYIDSILSYLCWDTEKFAAGILSACRQLTTLGLYYHYDNHWPLVSQEVLFLAEKGRLAHLGIYSHTSKLWSVGYEAHAVTSLIALLSNSSLARESIKTLELAVDSISMETFTTIRSRFSSLQSLTLRSTLRAVLDTQWDSDRQKYWMPYHNIRRLQLTGCQKGFYEHIPFLVHLFPALRELFISRVVRRHQPVAWNRPAEAPRQVRKPLDLFHIEKAEEEEIRKVAQIPTKTLILTAVWLKHILKILKESEDSFPGLETLCHRPINFSTSRDISRHLELWGVCHRRGITIRPDAIPVFHLSQED
jgi:hypothetical protein